MRLLLLVIISCGFCGEFFVDSFQSGRVIPQTSRYLTPIKGTYLEATNFPIIGRGQMLLRRKFGKDDYCLFIGKSSPGNFAELTPIMLPESITLQTAIKLKFYLSGDQEFYRDITDVYFGNDGKVYFNNLSQAYYFLDDKWWSIGVIKKGPSLVSLSVSALTGTGVGASELNVLTNRLRTELRKTGKFQVLPQGGGQAQGYVVTGSIGKIENVYTANVNMLDQSTGMVVKDIAQDCEGCGLSDVLTVTIGKLASALAGVEVSGTYIKTAKQPAVSPKTAVPPMAPIPPQSTGSVDAVKKSSPPASVKPEPVRAPAPNLGPTTPPLASPNTTTNIYKKRKDPALAGMLGMMPGLGHFYLGQQVFGTLYMTSAIYCIAPIVKAQQNKSDLKGRIDNATISIIKKKLQDQYDQEHKTFKLYMSIETGLICLSMLHAYQSGITYNKKLHKKYSRLLILPVTDFNSAGIVAAASF